MPKEHILALDEGTTGVRALVLDVDGTVRGHAYRPIRTDCPSPGLVEHDPEYLLEATLDAIRSGLAAARLSPQDLAGLGIATQRATVVLWNATTGRPLHSALSWQDQRTVARCQELQAAGHWTSPLASATKIEWLLTNVGAAAGGLKDLRVGTIDSWLVWQLTGGRTHVTDASNASCTGLYDVFTGGWDAEMLRTLGIPLEILPDIRSSSVIHGATDPGVVGAEIPIAGLAGDQQAAMFGQLCVEPGSMKATFGTSAMFDLHTGENPVLPVPGTFPLVLWQIDGQRAFCLEGSAITAGAAIQWLADGLGIIARPEDSELLAASVPDSGGAWAVPAFQGLGTPHMLAGVRAVLGGLSRATTGAHVVRAVLEGIAFRGREVLDALLESGAAPHPSVLRVNGGAARNNVLMQLEADVLGIPVERPKTTEAGAVGAAYLAGRAVGLWRDLDSLRRARQIDRIFEPRWTEAEREQHWSRWQRIVKAAIAAAES